jgi:hypothetical protein
MKEVMIRNRRPVTVPEIGSTIPSRDGQECTVGSCARGPGSRLSRLQQDLWPRDPDLLCHMKLLEQPDLYTNGWLNLTQFRYANDQSRGHTFLALFRIRMFPGRLSEK